jgi:hypothetical protein
MLPLPACAGALGVGFGILVDLGPRSWDVDPGWLSTGAEED